MQRIEVHPDLLEEKARLVQQKKQELERIVRELEKSIYFLESEWSGVTGERFFWDFMQVKEVFLTTLGLLDDIQNEFTFIAKNFRTTDGSGEVALYIPEELKRNFGVGLIDKSIGETVTGMGQTAEALFYDPFGTVASVAYAMTVGRVVDVGRGIKFAFDTAWGNGTARSEVEQFVEEQKKQGAQDGWGYYSGSMAGQVLAYAFFGKAFHAVENKHSDLGGSSRGKVEPGKGKEGIGNIKLTEPSLPKGGKPKGYYGVGDSHGIKKQNETADFLADQGYEIKMLDEVNGGNRYGIKETSNPDFLIQGNVFDCYAPTVDAKVDNILRNITTKTKTQAERIVLNLDQFAPEKVTEITQGILRKANPNGDLKNLKEILFVKDGNITRVFGEEK